MTDLTLVYDGCPYQIGVMSYRRIAVTPAELRAARERMNLTQQELAEALGLSKSTIENYETGRRREDGRAVEIPKAIELACTAVSLRLAAEKSNPRLLTADARIQARLAMYHLSLPSWMSYGRGQSGEFPTHHAALQELGDIPKDEPSLMEMLFPYVDARELRQLMYKVHREANERRDAAE